MARPGGWFRHASFAAAVLGCLAAGGVAGHLTRFEGPIASLGGPNGVVYDAAIAVSHALGRRRSEPTVVFVSVDDESLAEPPLAKVPRALFQPFWAELVDGLLEAGARKVAFDVVFAYAGDEFEVGDFRIPDYDRTLLETLARTRGRVVLGRYPGVPPKASFARAASPRNVAVLDLQPESDGRVRSAAPLLHVAEGRLAFGFAALAAGFGPEEMQGRERLLVAPTGPLIRRPTFRIGDLLGCLKEEAGRAAVAAAVRDKVVVVGSSLPGEDEHRGPTRFIGETVGRQAAGIGCAPAPTASPALAGDELIPGALIQAAAIEEAMRPDPVRLAPGWLVTTAGALLAALFGGLALTTRAPLQAVGSPSARRRWSLHSIAWLTLLAISGPIVVGGLASIATFVVAAVWLPLGGPVLAALCLAAAITTVRSLRHRHEFDRLFEVAGRYLPLAFLSDQSRSGEQGAEREVTLLLADFIGFTDFITDPKLTPSDVVREVNRHFSVMQDAVDRWGGYTDKFIGDAILSFWNGISDEPDHARKGLAAGRAIIDDLARLHADGGGLRARVVVATGRVYLGDLGADQRRNLTIVGPVVNEAFRLEKAPDLYGVPMVASAGVHDSCGGVAPDGQAFVHIDDIALKGFVGLRPVWALIDLADLGLAAYQSGDAAAAAGQRAEAIAAFASVETGALAVAAARRLRALAEDAARDVPQALSPAGAQG